VNDERRMLLLARRGKHVTKTSKGIDLHHATVAITGGARGIGRAIGESCARAGARVAVGDLVEATAAQAAADIGGPAIGLALDVSNDASFAGYLDAVEAHLGPLDILVNNAGVFAAGPFHEEAGVITDRIVDTNVRGMLVGSKLALQRMLPRDHGWIVNVASIGAVVPTGGAVTYSATKAAVLAASRALRWELCDTGIGVTCVMPGTIRTEMTAQLAAPPRPSPQPLEPVEVGAAVVEALRAGTLEVFVPGSLAPASKLLALLSPRAGDALKRATGFHRMVANRDRETERRYQERVAAEREGQA
jgi:NAD(P)-dependent dehydrogenase (short-subunit alcohol dehydrogenase family)